MFASYQLMLVYIIDGYNLMFRVVRAGDDLRTQREAIIKDLNVKLQLLGVEALVVFDAHYQYGDSYRTHFRHLEILFTSQGETADEYILKRVKASSKPENCVVVTSDKRLAAAARRRSAKAESVEEFLGWVNKRFANKIRRKNPPEKFQEKSPFVVEQPKKLDHPPPPATPEECFAYYLEEFEKKLSQIVQENPPRKKEELKKFKSRKKKFKPEKRREGEDDMERWLKAFDP